MRLPSACPVCGAISLAPEGEASALLAVCDALVVAALQRMGKWIVRAERARYREKGTRPWHEAHTLWPADDETVTRALHDAWVIVPLMMSRHGCCDVTAVQVTGLLDAYVHDLVLTGTKHTVQELAYRFTDHLGLPVYLNGWDPDEAAREHAHT